MLIVPIWRLMVFVVVNGSVVRLGGSAGIFTYMEMTSLSSWEILLFSLAYSHTTRSRQLLVSSV